MPWSEDGQTWFDAGEPALPVICPTCQPAAPEPYVPGYCSAHMPSAAGPDDDKAGRVTGVYLNTGGEGGGVDNQVMCESIHRPAGTPAREGT